MPDKAWDQRRGARSDSRVANRYVAAVQTGGGGCLLALAAWPLTMIIKGGGEAEGLGAFLGRALREWAGWERQARTWAEADRRARGGAAPIVLHMLTEAEADAWAADPERERERQAAPRIPRRLPRADRPEGGRP